MGDILQNLFQEYKNAVSQNSASIAQFESAFRLISYAIAGRFEDSTIISELLYSASNLLVLFNDVILKKAAGVLPNVTTSKEKLERIVTVLEYVGVFVELAAARFYGEAGRWVAITALQIGKCICRFLLFAVHKCGIQPVPPISPVDRDSIMKKSQSEERKSQAQNLESSDEMAKAARPSFTMTLKRSGKTMRTLNQAIPVRSRDWKLPSNENPMANTKRKGNSTPTTLTSAQTWGECLYIFKPLVHLASLYVHGTKSFKPWLLSSGMDIGSMWLLGDEKFNDNEKAEMRRRCLMLLMYLLRSPFYDNYSKARLLSLLRCLSRRIPLVSLVLVPLMEYLPVWQRIYFYTWSS